MSHSFSQSVSLNVTHINTLLPPADCLPAAVGGTCNSEILVGNMLSTEVERESGRESGREREGERDREFVYVVKYLFSNKNIFLLIFLVPLLSALASRRYGNLL